MSKVIEFIGNQLKAQAPILTALAAKTVFDSVRSKVVYEVTLRSGTLEYNQLEEWLFNNYKDKFQNVSVVFDDFDSDELKFEQRNDSFFIWFQSHPIHLSKVVEINEESYDRNEHGTYILKTAFNKSIIADLLKEVMSFYEQDKTEDDKLTVKTYYGCWRTHKKYYPKNIEDIILNEGIKESILESIKVWREDAVLLKKHRLSTILTHLYEGLPGTGKSSVSASIAHNFGMNLYYLDLSEITDLQDLKNAFDGVPSNSILLIEDIDLVYKGRKRISKTGVKFDAFINFLDGVLIKGDIMIIMTTNHLENLDPAMIRAGRVNLKCHFTSPSIDMVIAFLTGFYDTKVTLDNVKCMPLSMAELEQWCIKNLRDINGVLDILNNEPCKEIINSRNYSPIIKRVKSKKRKNSKTKSSNSSMVPIPQPKLPKE